MLLRCSLCNHDHGQLQVLDLHRSMQQVVLSRITHNSSLVTVGMALKYAEILSYHSRVAKMVLWPEVH